MPKQLRVSDIQAYKNSDHVIAMLTAYDYPMGRFLDEAGVDMILVGDSLANVVLGYETVLQVTVKDMIHHCSAVARGIQRSLLICDMPFGSYQVSDEQALKNAIKLVSLGSAHAVKLEGGQERAQTVQKIVQAGIPVMAHIGLRPQSIHQQSGYKKQGKTEDAKKQLMQDALALQDSGAFAMVLECIDAGLASDISKALDIPTIGIGSGHDCDGQVLVTQDMLGMGGGYVPSFVKVQADLKEQIISGVQSYIKDIQKK